MDKFFASSDSREDVNEKVLAAQNGDGDAMTGLLSDFASLVGQLSSAYKTSGLEPEDLFQEGMLGLVSAVKSYSEKGEASFRTYAGICISNRLKTAVQNAQRKKHAPLNNAVSLDEQEDLLAASHINSPEELLISQEAVFSLENLLTKKLSAFELKVARLHISGLSYDEIAEKPDTDSKAIDNAVQRIRRKIRVTLSP